MTTPAAEAAEALSTEVTDTARANLVLAEVAFGDPDCPLCPGTMDAIEFGVQLGFASTVQVLARHGLLQPNAAAPVDGSPDHGGNDA